MTAIEITNGQIFVVIGNYRQECQSLTEAAKEAHFLMQHFGLPNTIIGSKQMVKL